MAAEAQASESILRFRALAAAALDDVERALRETRPPAPLPGLSPPPEPVPESTREQLGRLARAVRVLHAAVTRYAARMAGEREDPPADVTLP